MSLLENVTLHMELDNSDFKREFKEATTVVDKQMNALTLGADAFAAKWEDITSNLRSFKRVASGLAISAGIYAVTGAITGASEAILTFRNNLEASEISMSYFAQDALQAKEYIRELEDFAASTPFSTESAISMAQYLQAMSVPINNSKSMLKVISDTAAATGATEENMQRIVTALGQILTKGKLAAEEVRQLANANIPIYNILKEQLKLTGQEIKNLGKLNINASKAVVAILDGLKERYEGAADKIADTLGGMTETIKDDALIISEAFFHGSLDRLEDKITVIRDKLDSWRDIGLHYGTGGMIQAIIGDIDPDGSKHLEDFIISAVAGFKNLGDTVHEFVTKNGTALTVFTKTAYTGIMSLTIAADYLLRVFNKVQDVGDTVIEKINKLTGMSLELSDVVAGLLVFRTVGKTIYFAGNTALWAGKQFLNLGTAIANMLPMMASASAFSRGLVSGLLTLGAAATTAYFGLKAIQGATGVTEGSSLISEDYKQQMEEYNNALNKYTDSLNEDYSAIADNWAAEMSGALDDTEKKAKKTAKKIEKTWLMSFDEVFQIREDPVSKAVDDSLKLFEDINWGDFFTLPEFRFPKELDDALTQPAYSLADAIDTAQDQVGLLNTLLPVVISGVGLIGTILKNRRDAVEKARKAGVDEESLMSDKERAAKLDAEIKSVSEFNESVEKAAQTVEKEVKAADDLLSAQIRATSERLKAEYDLAAAQRALAKKYTGAVESNSAAELALQKAREREAAILAKEIPNISTSAEYTKQGVNELNKQLNSINKKLVSSGKEIIVDHGGITAGNTALTNANILKRLEEVVPAYYRLVDTTTEILTLGRKANFITNLAELHDTQLALIAGQRSAAVQTDTFIEQLKPIVNQVSKAAGKNPDVLNNKTLAMLLSEAYGTQTRRLASLFRQVVGSSAKEVAENIGDTILPTYKSIESAIKGVREFGDKLGIALETFEESAATNKLLAAIGEVAKPASDATDILTKLGILLDARNNSDNPNLGAERISQLTDTYKESLGILETRMATVQALDDVAISIQADMHSIREIVNKASALTNQIMSREQVTTILQTVQDTLDYLKTSPAAYSSKTTITRDYLTAKLADLQSSINALGSDSLTKNSSNTVLTTALETLGDKAADSLKTLTSAIYEYKSDITGILNDKADSLLATAQNIRERLAVGAVITEQELTSVDRNLNLIANRVKLIKEFNISSIGGSAGYDAMKSREALLDAINKRLSQPVPILVKDAKTFLTKFADIVEKSALKSDKELASKLNFLIEKTPRVLFSNEHISKLTPFITEAFEKANLTVTVPNVYSLSGAATGVPGGSTEAYELKQIVDEVVETTKNKEAFQAVVDGFESKLKELGFKDIVDYATTSSTTGILTSIQKELEKTNDIAVATQTVITPFTANVSHSFWQLHDDLVHAASADQAKDIISAFNLRLTQAAQFQKEALTALSDVSNTVATAVDNARAGIDVPEGVRYGYISNKDAAELVDGIYKRYEEALTHTNEIVAALEKGSKNPWMNLAAQYGAYMPLGKNATIHDLAGGYARWDDSRSILDKNYFKDFIGKDNFLSDPQKAAKAIRKILGLDSGMTKSGATYTTTVATMTGAIARELTNELVEQFETEFNMAAAAVLNMVTRKSISDKYGALYRAGDISDETGIISARLAGILKTTGDTAENIGVIQSAVIRARNSFIYSYLQDLAASGKRTVTLVEFLTAAAAKAPDIASNVMNAFIAAPKLKSMLLSVVNAKEPILSTGASLYDKVLDNLFNNLGKDSKSRTIEEYSKYVKDIVSTNLLRESIPADVIGKAVKDVFITASDPASMQTLATYVREINMQQAEQLKNSLTIANVAKQHKVYLDMLQHTAAGKTVDPAARYSTAAILNKITTISEQLANINDDALFNAGMPRDTISKLDAVIKDMTTYAFKSGDLPAARGLLQDIQKGISEGNLYLKTTIATSTDIEAATDKFVTHEIKVSGISGNLKDTIEEAIDNTVSSYNAYYTSLLSTWYVEYNDKASQIYALFENLRNANMLTGGQTGTEASIIRDATNDIYMMITAAKKLEAAEGFAPYSSSIAMDLVKGNSLGFLQNFDKGTDPLAFESATQANARWLKELQQVTGKPLDKLFDADTLARMSKYLKVDAVVPEEAVAKAASDISVPRLDVSDVLDMYEASTTPTKTTQEIIDAADEYLKDLARSRTASSSTVPAGSQFDRIDKFYKDTVAQWENIESLDKYAIPEELYEELFNDFEGPFIDAKWRSTNSSSKYFDDFARATQAYREGTAEFTAALDRMPTTYYNGTRMSNMPWYNAVADEDVMKTILGSLPEDSVQRSIYTDFVNYVWEKFDSLDFEYGQGMTGKGLKDTNTILEDTFKEFISDDAFKKTYNNVDVKFEDWDKIVKAADYVSGGGGTNGPFTGIGTISDAFNNDFVQKVLMPNDVGISGIDWAFALKHAIDALSGGIDEFSAISDRWQQMTGYNITALNASGKTVDNGNLVNLAQAALPGVESLVLEGAVTTAISSAAATAITSALGVSGLAAAGAGVVASLPVALLVSLFMAATGAFNQSNIASENWKEMLNDTTWVTEQAKAQGASDKEAKQAQLDVARDIYTNYYNNMSSIWSMYDKASIRSIDKYGSDNFTGEKNKSSYRFAVEEIIGRPDIYGLQKSKTETGWLNYGEGDTGWVARELDAAKMEQQLYTLYTTGGMDKILNKKGNYTDLEEDWLHRLDYLGEYQIAQLNDYYRDYVNAIQYINEHTKEEIVALLQGYNLPANTMQDMVEGIVAIYRAGIEQMNQLIDIKGQFINLGSISTVGLDELATGTGSVMRAMEGDLTGIDQKYLDMLADATGVYVSAMSDTMYTLAYDIEAVRDKMTGFTVTFPDTVTVGADTISVKDIASNTKSVEILHGMGIHINNDGTVTVSTEAVNANESGHSRRMAVSYNDISEYELAALSSAGIDLSNSRNDKTRISLDEAAMQNSIKGMTYNLAGVDLKAVSEATVTALKAKGILLSQNQETGATYATITDTGFITGANDIASLISSLDPELISRMAPTLQAALRGIDAINAFGSKHGESRMGSAAGVEIDTGLLGTEYSAALEQAFTDAGITLQRTIDADGNEHVYAAINNVGEQWHKAITQWQGKLSPELKKFLADLGVEVAEYGDYTMVSTEDVIKSLSKSSSSGLRNILFDNAELWEQFPEETKNAFIAAGLATEDGFIKLDTEAIDGWYRYEVDGQTHMAKAFEAMEQSIVDHFLKMQGNTVISWSALTEEQRLALEKLGITTEQQYNTNSDELLQLITGKNAVVKDNVVQGWNTLSAEQKALLAQIGIENEEQYAAHFQELYTIGNTNFGILNEDTILGWDELSGTTKAKLSEMGITTEAQYNEYLNSMNVATGQGLSTVDTTTAESLLKIGATTSSGWGDIKQVTDTTLSETEKLALGYMKFEDLPETVRNALSMEAGVGKDLHDSWWAINSDADEQMDIFANTTDRMATELDTIKDLAAQLKQALADPTLNAEQLNANLAAGAATALKAAKGWSDDWAHKGSSIYGYVGGSYGMGESDKNGLGTNTWSDWDNDLQLVSSQVAISDVLQDASGMPMVYYIYNLDVDGTPGQIIKNSEGIWRKYYGSRQFSTDNPPQFKLGGMVTGDGLFRAGEFGLNEAIVPLEQPQAMRKIGNALAAALPTWELVAPLQQAIGMRDAGVAQFNSFRSDKAESSVEEIVTRIMDAQAHKAPTTSTSYDDRRPLYVGTLIADKAGLRELDRQMKRVSRQDGGM